MVNFTKLGLRFHQNASLIKNVYCNYETPILFQLFKQFEDFVLEMGKKKKRQMKEKKKNNNRCILLISNTVIVFGTLQYLSCLCEL